MGYVPCLVKNCTDVAANQGKGTTANEQLLTEFFGTQKVEIGKEIEQPRWTDPNANYQGYPFGIRAHKTNPGIPASDEEMNEKPTIDLAQIWKKYNRFGVLPNEVIEEYMPFELNAKLHGLIPPKVRPGEIRDEINTGALLRNLIIVEEELKCSFPHSHLLRELRSGGPRLGQPQIFVIVTPLTKPYTIVNINGEQSIGVQGVNCYCPIFLTPEEIRAIQVNKTDPLCFVCSDHKDNKLGSLIVSINCLITGSIASMLEEIAKNRGSASTFQTSVYYDLLIWIYHSFGEHIGLKQEQIQGLIILAMSIIRGHLASFENGQKEVKTWLENLPANIITAGNSENEFSPEVSLS